MLRSDSRVTSVTRGVVCQPHGSLSSMDTKYLGWLPTISNREVSLVCYYNDKSIRNIPSIINSCCEERIAWFQDRIDSNYYTNYVYESRSLGNEEGKRELASSLLQKGKGKGLRGRKWLAETTPGSANDAKRFPFSRREGEGLER